MFFSNYFSFNRKEKAKYNTIYFKLVQIPYTYRMHFMEAKSVLSVSAQLVQNTISLYFTREPPSFPILFFS